MKQEFIKPDFSEGIIEFRIHEGEVAIYATPEGLRWLAQKCLVLVDAGKTDHLHLGDFQVLTRKSNPATVAQFTTD